MKSKLKKILKVAGLILALLLIYFYVGLNEKPAKMEWGVTFSPSYAESLGLYWPEVYRALLDDLKVSNVRLSAYWDGVEPQDSRFDFTVLDYQIAEASRRGVKILLAVGRRLPRWPECHVPDWARDLPEERQQEKLLDYVGRVVERYRNEPAITMWQVENEFFLRRFGECPKANPKLLDKELAIVREKDSRPVVLSDSGELGGWFGSIRRADVFGTTMYRTVYNPRFGYATYPLRPIFYKRRFLLYRLLGRAQKIINVELQAEPWAQTSLTNDSLEVQYRSFNPQKFEENIAYAKASGLSPAYLWGAEWWYYMSKVKGEGQIWEIAKKLWPPQ